MKVFLVGLPGAGKSTFGKTLARRLLLDFFDLDHIISDHQKLTIGEIFEKKGEDRFREIEHDALKSITAVHENFFLATGGGTPCFFDNMKYMNQKGITIFLNTSITTIVERVSRNDKRPLLKNQNPEEKIKTLYNLRLPYYQKAHFVIDESQLYGSALDQVVNKIKAVAQGHCF
jgi:shikimate kinase